MSYIVKCNSGYRIYDTEVETIEEAREHVRKMFRLHADSGPKGSGYIASQLPRIDREIDNITEGTVHTLPGGGSGQTSWTIKKKSLRW